MTDVLGRVKGKDEVEDTGKEHEANFEASAFAEGIAKFNSGVDADEEVISQDKDEND